MLDILNYADKYIEIPYWDNILICYFTQMFYYFFSTYVVDESSHKGFNSLIFILF